VGADQSMKRKEEKENNAKRAFVESGAGTDMVTQSQNERRNLYFEDTEGGRDVETWREVIAFRRNKKAFKEHRVAKNGLR